MEDIKETPTNFCS